MPGDHALDACIRCGYDLAGLPVSGVCPECAFPVARSRSRSNLLRDADPAWLDRVHGGLHALARAQWLLLLMLVGSVVAALVLAMALGALDYAGGRSVLPRTVALWLFVGAGGLAAVAAAGFHTVGCWRLSAPAHAEYALPGRARLGLRLCGTLLPLTVAATLIPQALWALPAPARFALHLAFQVNAVAYFLALASALQALEVRTILGAGAGTFDRYRLLRRNLWAVGALVVLFCGVTARGNADWGIIPFGITYLAMDTTLSRVRYAVQREHAEAHSPGRERRAPASA